MLAMMAPGLTFQHYVVLSHAEGLVLDVDVVLPTPEALTQVLQLTLTHLKETHLRTHTNNRQPQEHLMNYTFSRCAGAGVRWPNSTRQ
jgi:hypothetical protein